VVCFSKLRASVGSYRAARARRRDDNERQSPPQDGFFRLIAFLLIVIFGVVWFVLDRYQLAAPAEQFRVFAEKLVEAFFIAATLAFSVDIFLKKQIARDAFRASMGYILPDYLQDEMRAVYSNEIICIDHLQNVKVEILNDELVTTTITLYRKLKNISNNNHSIVPKARVDEWLVANAASKIGACGYKVEGGEEHHFGPAAPDDIHPAPRLIAVGTDEVILQPRAEMEVWASYSQIKRRSDLSCSTFGYATQTPRVHLTVPEGFGYYVEFTHRLKGKKLPTDDIILPGLLLPHQCIIARWWAEDKKKAWNDDRKRERAQTPQTAS
jgi:hypothetical protein